MVANIESSTVFSIPELLWHSDDVLTQMEREYASRAGHMAAPEQLRRIDRQRAVYNHFLLLYKAEVAVKPHTNDIGDAP